MCFFPNLIIFSPPHFFPTCVFAKTGKQKTKKVRQERNFMIFYYLFFSLIFVSRQQTNCHNKPSTVHNHLQHHRGSNFHRSMETQNSTRDGNTSNTSEEHRSKEILLLCPDVILELGRNWTGLARVGLPLGSSARENTASDIALAGHADGEGAREEERPQSRIHQTGAHREIGGGSGPENASGDHFASVGFGTSSELVRGEGLAFTRSSFLIFIRS